jgi:hypothetical protein
MNIWVKIILVARVQSFGVLLAVAAAGAGQGMQTVPDELKPPPGEELVARAHASGDQIYACDGAHWILSGPDAKLSDEAGRETGRHFTGPTWEWSDGSRVAGRPVSSVAPDPGSIPWLLLTATSHDGEGVLTKVSSIQRLHTTGGKAPASGCMASRKDEKVRIPYTADYYFYAPRQ